MSDLVKIKNFPDRIYAERARQTLESEGIPSLIQSIDIGFLGAGGVAGFPQGVDLYVPSDDADRAREILDVMFDGV
jgi:hypothetical protein